MTSQQPEPFKMGKKYIESLTYWEKYILEQRVVHDRLLQSIADELGVTIQRAQQLEAQAMFKVHSGAEEDPYYVSLANTPLIKEDVTYRLQRGITPVFSRTLEVVRGSMGVTKGKFSRMMGKSPQVYTYYMNGRLPGVEALLDLAEMGVDLHWLLCGEPYANNEHNGKVCATADLPCPFFKAVPTLHSDTDTTNPG